MLFLAISPFIQHPYACVYSPIFVWSQDGFYSLRHCAFWEIAGTSILGGNFPSGLIRCHDVPTSFCPWGKWHLCRDNEWPEWEVLAAPAVSLALCCWEWHLLHLVKFNSVHAAKRGDRKRRQAEESRQWKGHKDARKANRNEEKEKRAGGKRERGTQEPHSRHHGGIYYTLRKS